MSESPYLGMVVHVLAFACWSSFWPRQAIKGRIEPVVGFMAYRLFYNAGTIFLFCSSFAYLTHQSMHTQQLWNIRQAAWFPPVMYAIEGIGVFFLSACTQLGLSFWGLTKPGPDQGLQTGGFYKITRHPLYWSVFCLLFGHMLVLGSSLAVLYFVLMETYNVAGVIAFENPALARHYGKPFAEFHDRVSTIPFLSLLRGDVTMTREEVPVGKIVGSVLFTALVIFVHNQSLVPFIHGLPDLNTLLSASN